MTRNPHIGSALEDFLEDENLLEETTAVAVKRVIAWQIQQAMKNAGVSKAALARRMQTSRTVIDRMLDDTDTGLTLETMKRVASALGVQVKIDFVQQ